MREQGLAGCRAKQSPMRFNIIFATITVAFLVASTAGYFLLPSTAQSADAFAYLAPFDDEVSDVDEIESTPTVQLREREFVTEHSIEWVDESVDIPLPPKPVIEDAHTVSQQGAVPHEAIVSRSETTTVATQPTATTTVAHVRPPHVKAAVEAPKRAVKKVAAPVSPAAQPAHLCGTMQKCLAATARDPNVVHIMRACRSVLNGGRSAQARAACDSIFAMTVPGESGVPDDQRRRAAAVCRGMPKCSELVMKRPSAARLVHACGVALIRGSGPAADACDRAVMSRI